MWGLIAVGLFHKKNGLLLGVGKFDENVAFFGVQVLGMLSIVAWVAVMCFIFFKVVDYWGKFRVSPTEEVLGLDISEMDADSIPHIDEAVLLWRVKQLGKQKKELDDIETPSERKV